MFILKSISTSHQVTFFIYLNTLGEAEGGCTKFPLLEPPLAVRPKAGTALVWCNVEASSPYAYMDPCCC